MKQKELKKLVNAALIKANEGIEILKGNDNPQIVEMRNKLFGQAQAFAAVSEALENRKALLKILGE